MGISLVSIATNTSTVTFKHGEEDVNITYYPGRVTERVVQQLNAFSRMKPDTMEQGFSEFNKMLANLIKSWDVYEDAEQTVMFPVDPARFAELPIGFRMEVVGAIMGNLRPETVAPRTMN